MADQILTRVRASLAAQNLLRPHALLLVAVSGGPDSLCLLHVLHRLQAENGPALHVAHLDHGFRGAESAAEAAFVGATAAAWGIPATLAERDVPTLARATRRSPQAAARTARYAFLAGTASATGAHAVLVAHQAEDQAETVVMHLLRGTGIGGLRGMRPVVPAAEWAAAHAPALVAPLSAPLLRPLLATTRAEIEAYCTLHGLEPRRDPSNRASRYMRSRVRERVMPVLAAENPRIVEALGRTAALCADDYVFIASQLELCWPNLAREKPQAITFDRAVWATLPPTLRRYALRRAARVLVDSEELSLAQIEAALLVAERSASQPHELGLGLRLEVSYNTLTVLKPEMTDIADARFPQLATDQLLLPVPGRVDLGQGWHAKARTVGQTNNGPWRVALDRLKLDEPLLLRRRLAGERFRPAGGRGSRSLQDLFVDSKIPRQYRANWPILATASGIVWVVGLRAAAGLLADATTANVLWVEFNRIGEEG